MATTLIVPGIGGGGADHWLTWLQQALPGSKRVSQSDWTSLNLDRWSATLRRSIGLEIEPVWIVTHDFGCLAAVDASNDCPECVAGLVLVAPLDPYQHLHPSSLPPQPLN